MRRRFPSASLIATIGGTTHANTLQGNPCVDDPIAAYLQDGTTPKRRHGNGPDAVCAAAPQPEPDAAATADARISARDAALNAVRVAMMAGRR